VVTGLLAKERVNAPIPIDPPVDPGDIQAVEYVDYVVSSQSRPRPARRRTCRGRLGRASSFLIAAPIDLVAIPVLPDSAQHVISLR
jgi:hypothetical protein